MGLATELRELAARYPPESMPPEGMERAAAILARFRKLSMADRRAVLIRAFPDYRHLEGMLFNPLRREGWEAIETAADAEWLAGFLATQDEDLVARHLFRFRARRRLKLLRLIAARDARKGCDIGVRMEILRALLEPSMVQRVWTSGARGV